MSSINANKVKTYTCYFCKEKYDTPAWKRNANSLKGIKKHCQGIDCTAKAGAAYIEKVKQKQKKEWNGRKRKMRKQIKSVADWKNDLQAVINWIAREIDKDQKCISHPEMTGFLRYDAGHYYSVKAHSDVRFNLHNIHKQNSQANEQSGGGPAYALGIKNRYGIEYLEMMLGLPLKYKGIGKEKFKIKDIKEFYLRNARSVQREMKEGKKYTRDQVNELIGIYS